MSISRGLLAVCIAVAVVVGLPVVITVIQAFQGGVAAAKAAITESATPTLLLHTVELAALVSALVQAFTRESHITVSVRTGDGIALADQILQEGNSSPADVYLTENSPELMNLEAHGLLARLPAGILDQVPARDRSPGGEWVGVALRVSSLAYDPAKISASQLPRSVLALGQPQWKGRIAVAPTDSDFPPVVGAIIATYGKTAAAHWLAGIKRNAQTYQDEEGVVAAPSSRASVRSVHHQRDGPTHPGRQLRLRISGTKRDRAEPGPAAARQHLRRDAQSGRAWNRSDGGPADRAGRPRLNPRTGPISTQDQPGDQPLGRCARGQFDVA